MNNSLIRFSIFSILALSLSVNSFGQIQEKQETEKSINVSDDIPPLPPHTDKPDVFKVVEQMPRFPGCEDMPVSDMEKESCAKEKMLQYIYSNLKYPSEAIEKDVEGMAVIQFVVLEDGSIANVKIVRDPGAGCGDAAKEVVEGMNDLPQKWTPGKQRGKNIGVLYTLPVKFKNQKPKRTLKSKRRKRFK